jgi:hypothetical protein
MAIALVQQSTTGSYAGGSLSASATLSGVTSGNTLISIICHLDEGGTTPTFTLSDGQGTYAQDSTALGTYESVVIGSLFTANSGSHTVTGTAGSGTTSNSFGRIILTEWSGIATSGQDQASSNIYNNNITQPTTGTTAGLATSSDLIIAALSFGNVSTGGTFPPTGGPGTYTSLMSAQAYGFGFGDMDYQIIASSSAGVSAAWGTLSNSGKGAAAIMTYKPTGGVTVNLLGQACL